MDKERAGSPPSYGDSQSGFPTGQGAGGYPPQGAGGYPPQGAGGYPPQGAGGYPQGAGYPAGEYPPKPQPGPYGQPGYMQPGYGQTYVQQTAQADRTSTHVILRPRPPNYMVASIFACLCCFWPTGLFAIYYASQANKFAAEGDMAEATIKSNRARNLMIASIVIGIIWIILVIVLRVVVYASYYSYNY